VSAVARTVNLRTSQLTIYGLQYAVMYGVVVVEQTFNIYRKKTIKRPFGNNY